MPSLSQLARKQEKSARFCRLAYRSQSAKGAAPGGAFCLFIRLHLAGLRFHLRRGRVRLRLYGGGLACSAGDVESVCVTCVGAARKLLGKGSRRFVPGASHCLPRGGVSKEFASRARKRALAAPRRRTQGICLLAHIVQRAPANTGRHVYEELASGARALPAVRTARRLLRPQGHDGILLCRAAGGDDARDEREQHADEHQHERDVHGEDGV